MSDRAASLIAFLEAVALGRDEASEAEVAQAIGELDALVPNLPEEPAS